MKKQSILFLVIILTLNFNFVFSQQTLVPTWTTESNTVNAYMGSDLGQVGDLNGDGYKDIFIRSANKINIYYGSSSGFANNPDLMLQEAGVNYISLTYGDLNNDGKDELITSDYLNNNFRIFYGRTTGINATADYIYTAPENSGAFGYGIDASGDINKDGYDDLIVGQPTYNRGFGLYGKTLVFPGTSTGISSSPHQTITTIIGTIGIGTQVAYAGDVNKDGYEDVLISSQAVAGVTLLSSERVELYLGSSNGTLLSTSWYDLGKVINLGKAFDVNGDSYDDISVTYYNSSNDTYNGYIYQGTSTGLGLNPSFKKQGGFTGTLTGIGDFNNDNYADIVINDQLYDEYPYINEGKIEIYIGSSTGILTSPYFVYKSNVNNAAIGKIACSGDLNKDGFDDLLVGWSNYKSPETNEGRALLFYGKTTLISNFTVDKIKDCLIGNTFNFTNQAQNDVVSYTWDFGDGTTSTQSNPTHSYTSGGIYTISLLVKNSIGQTATKTINNYITVKNPAPGGIYTMGGTAPDFANIAQLNNFIECGISGDMTIKIRPGKYDDHLKISKVNNPGFKLIIESENLNANAVRIGAITINNSINININYVSVFDTLPINPLPISTVLIKNSQNIRINNCNVYRPFSNLPYNIKIDSCSNISIKKAYLDYVPDTTKTGAHYGIFFNHSSLITIDSSTIIAPYFLAYGLTGNNSTNIIISNNLIRGRGTNRSYRGIFLDSIQGLSMTNNQLYAIERPVVISNTKGTSLLKLIANNTVGENIGTNNYYDSGNGAELIQCDNMDFLHNTISYTQVGTYNGFFTLCALGVSSSNSVIIKNNILKSASGTVCLFIINSTNIQSDYNLFAGKAALINLDQQIDLYQWRSASGLDMNSIQDQIGFESATKLKPSFNKDRINEAAFLFPEVPTDMINTARGPNTADIGAYNVGGDTIHFALVKNIYILKITNDTLQIGNNSISVKFTNLKPIPVDSVYLSYQINGGAVITELWKGSLNYQDTITYTFNTLFNVPKGKIYFTECRAVLSSNQTDSDTTNNIIQKQVYAKMNGVYTVYGNTPDFITIKEANNNLTKSGIATKVIFAIRPGIYTDTLTLESGPVEYRSETNNANDVKMFLFHTRDKKNITVKHISLTNLYDNTSHPYDGTEISNCGNILFDSCVFLPCYSTILYAKGISVEPVSNNIRFYNCSFKKQYFGVTFNGRNQWYGESYLHGNLEVKKCIFDSVTYPVIITAQTIHVDQDSIIIANNIMKNPETGVYVPYYSTGASNNVAIYNNIIDSSSYSGIIIQTNYPQGYYKIYNNKIVSNLGDGIYVEGLINSEIFNNMITTNVTGSMNWRQGTDWVASGIHLQYAQNIKIYNNSLIGGFTAEYGNLSGIEFYNNSCYSDSAIMLFTTTAIYSGGNNNFYRKDGGFLVSIDDTAYTVIDSVNIASGQEKFSISNDPLYQSKTDLHTSSPYLQGRGRPYQSLTFDIDGDSRDQVHPAIGADENSITPINTRPQLISTLPANNRTSVPVDTSLILIFDRSICLNQGTIELYNFDTNSFIQMITLPSNYVVLIDTNKLKVPLIHNLAYGTHYYVTLSANTVYNYGMGNNLTNNPLSFNFTTKITAPTVTTQSVNSITTNQGIVTINIISDGGSAVLKSGVCWSTTGSPDFYSNNITSNSNLTGNHNLLLNALIPNTTYYVKAYAINQVDTVYGAVLSFRTDAISISTNVLYEKESISISIFPNPIISDMEIELSSNNLSLEIYSTLGILLYNQTMKEGLSVVPLAQLPQGLYYVRVLKEGKAIYVTEIVKE